MAKPTNPSPPPSSPSSPPPASPSPAPPASPPPSSPAPAPSGPGSAPTKGSPPPPSGPANAPKQQKAGGEQDEGDNSPQKQAQALGVNYEHVEGMARALGGGNWQKLLPYILQFLEFLAKLKIGAQPPAES